MSKTKPKPSKTLDQKLADAAVALDKARREFNRLSDLKTISDNRSLLGKCFRFRNCYSCPEGPGDYWFLYSRVDHLDEGGSPCGISVQKDMDGRITIQANDRVYITGAEEITASKFNKEVAVIEQEIIDLLP